MNIVSPRHFVEAENVNEHQSEQDVEASEASNCPQETTGAHAEPVFRVPSRGDPG